MEFKCSECGGKVTKKGRSLVCEDCGRSTKLSYGKFEVQKEIDMNEETKEKDVLFG